MGKAKTICIASVFAFKQNKEQFLIHVQPKKI